MYNAIIAKPHCIFVPAARAAGCELSVLLYILACDFVNRIPDNGKYDNGKK